MTVFPVVQLSQLSTTLLLLELLSSIDRRRVILHSTSFKAKLLRQTPFQPLTNLSQA